jgi:tRNA A-37 threonylcarbamoyl transferase component Bud32
MFRRLGRDSADAFCAWTGVFVNRHRDRQVERVTQDGHAFFLKKEHAVSWRQRLRNAWHGEGWCATAVREARLLLAARAAGIGCPEVAAFGEDGPRAFLLLDEASGMTELRAFLQQCPTANAEERRHLAESIGRELARLHDAGFDHPDLFANHLLISRTGATFRICMLDWQRARRCRRVGWRRRCRGLAALDASLHAALADSRLRLRCLRAYVRAVTSRRATPLARQARQIRRQALALGRKRNIREVAQLPVAAAQQQFVSLREGRLLVVCSFFEELGGRPPDWLMNFPSPALPQGAHKMRLHAWDVPATSAALWELPDLAHLLFRLQRFGVPAPRLLAAGHAASRGFLLISAEPAVPLLDALAHAPEPARDSLLRQAGWIEHQARAAGCHIPPGTAWHRQLGVDRSGSVMFTDIERQAVI